MNLPMRLLQFVVRLILWPMLATMLLLTAMLELSSDRDWASWRQYCDPFLKAVLFK